MNLSKCLKVLPTDYTEYGGEVERWKDSKIDYPDCSRGCKHWVPLYGDLGNDWGVCANENAPRQGLLTWEHMAGFGCFESDEKC